MRLTLDCPHCLRRYNKTVAKLEETLTGTELEISKSVIPKPKGVSILKKSVLGEQILTKYSCGHSVIIPKTQQVLLTKITSNTKAHRAYDYQIEGIEFIEKSNYNCLIADEMGLGKTIQAVLAIINNINQLTPCLIVVKSATMYQWIREFKEWGTLDDLGICPITSTKNVIIPIFKCYIVSMDLLPDVLDKLKSLGIKLVVADEVQGFKNIKSSRSKAIVNLCQTGGPDGGPIPHKIFLSGTPIKNRASEYFVVLNLLAPGHFPSFKQFEARWLEQVGKGSLNRIRPYALENFKTLTSRWILRREVCDVQKDLPPLRYATLEVEITDPIIKKMYNSKLDLFSNYLHDSSQKKDAMALLGWLAQLRHITAQAKTNDCCEFVKDFLDSTEEQKIAVGIHHKSVLQALHFGLEPYGPLKLSGEDSAQQKDWTIQSFKRPDKRVLIINEVSGGTGLDGLQCCNNVIILERQWNAADEDQFVKRFQRDGQTRPVLATYIVAKGTIDQFFGDLVEAKRAIVGETLSGYNIQNDAESLMSLAQTTIEHRL